MKKAIAILGLTLGVNVEAAPFTQAEVSRAVNQVSLVEKSSGSRAARLGDIVKGSTGVKTSGDSRAELRFPDLTVMRLGANTFFSFQAGGREMDLEGGTMLFSAPKGQGGGQVEAGAVTAAVTGTSFLLALYPNGDVKLIVLEGKVKLYLTANPSVQRTFRAGQMVTVASGTTDAIPKGVTIDLKQLLATSRLLESGGFGPLPEGVIIQRVASDQQGRIKLPDNLVVQAAQTSRRADGPPQPQRTPKQQQPPPPPPPPPPTPQPSYSPGP